MMAVMQHLVEGPYNALRYVDVGGVFGRVRQAMQQQALTGGILFDGEWVIVLIETPPGAEPLDAQPLDDGVLHEGLARMMPSLHDLRTVGVTRVGQAYARGWRTGYVDPQWTRELLALAERDLNAACALVVLTLEEVDAM